MWGIYTHLVVPLPWCGVGVGYIYLFSCIVAVAGCIYSYLVVPSPVGGGGVGRGDGGEVYTYLFSCTTTRVGGWGYIYLFSYTIALAVRGFERCIRTYLAVPPSWWGWGGVGWGREVYTDLFSCTRVLVGVGWGGVYRPI